jgi:uncharacterized membrane protein
VNTGGDARQRVVLGLAITCAVIAVLLGSVGLADASLWLDETFSVFDARRSIGDILAMRGEAYGGAHHPPGYFLLLKATIGLCGTGEVCVRAPSVLANAGLAAVLVVVGTRLFGIVAGAGAGLVWATTPYAIKYAQQARHYTLLALVCAVAIVLLVRVLGDRRPAHDRTFALLGLVLASGLWLHLFALPFLGMLALGVPLVLWLGREHVVRPTRRQWLITIAAGAIASAPLLPGMWRVWITGGGGQLASKSGPVENARELVVDLATFGLDTPWVPIVIACALLVPTWRARGLVIGLVVLAVAPLLVVFVRNPEHFVTLRYFMPSLVPVALAFGAGVGAVFGRSMQLAGKVAPARTQVVGASIAAVVLAWPMIAIGRLHDAGLRKQWATAGFEPWRDVAAAIRAAAQPGDVAVLVPFDLVEYPLLVYDLGMPLHAEADLAAALDEHPTGVFVVTSHIDRKERSDARRQVMRTISGARYVRAPLAGVPEQRAIEALLYRPR